MSPADLLAPGALPPVPVNVPADEFDNFVRKWGVGYCCDWFGCSDEAEATAAELKIRNEAATARALAVST